MIRLYTLQDPISPLHDLVLRWMEEAHQEDFGIDINPVTILEDINGMLTGPETDIFVKIKDDRVVGFMGIRKFESPHGEEYIASEHLWYVLPEYRGSGFREWIRVAEAWAQVIGCNHLIINASHLSSDSHDRLCGIFNKIGFKHLESSFIMKLKENDHVLQ